MKYPNKAERSRKSLLPRNWHQDEKGYNKRKNSNAELIQAKLKANSFQRRGSLEEGLQGIVKGCKKLTRKFNPSKERGA